MNAVADNIFRALADPTRRAIFEELTRQGEQTVHALTRYAGVSQPAVSKHLTVLKRAKLVRHRREGRETHYRAQPDSLAPMVNWLDQYGAFWRERFDRLETCLKGWSNERPKRMSPQPGYRKGILAHARETVARAYREHAAGAMDDEQRF